MSQQHFKDFLKNSLNENQIQAVTAKNGVLLVRAGAGSGKTRVITARIANLILNHQIPTHSIIALTFTNKAAKEMKERVANFLNDAVLPYVGTFHSYCYRLLKQNAHLLPFQPFTLLDDNDQEKIIKKLIAKYGLIKQVTPKSVLSFISRIKNDTTNELEKESAWENNKVLRDLYYLYEQEKRLAHCFDFDDLLLQTLNLLTTNIEFKQKFQQIIKHVLIDEYQDTNKVQHALLKAIALNVNCEFILDSLCIVGDEDQSIYSWRGATVSNILNFSKEFANTNIITIEQNYRSVQPILELANHVIKNNIGRNPKNLWSNKPASDRIRLLTYGSNYQEAEGCALFLKKSSKTTALNSHAILYRSHYQSRTLEEALIKHNIPYKIMGGIQFYDRLEIKDILAYLRLVINPYDRMAFSRIINTPSRGLGDKFEEQFFNIWMNQPFLKFNEIAQQMADSQQLTKTKLNSLIKFLEIFENITPDTNPSVAITEIVNKLNYYTYLKENFEKDEANTKKENIKELINGAIYFEEKSEIKTLDAFLESIALLQEQMNSNNESNDFVVLMTLHSAKGLEFDTVILPGLEEGVLPSTHAMFESESLEEERRLLYVGITRARERLLISNCKYRTTYGQMSDQRASRFIEEFDEQYINYSDCSHWLQNNFTNYFENWLDSNKIENFPKTNTQVKSKLKTIDNISDDPFEKETKITKVEHASFGMGIVEKIENKGDKSFYTIRFKSGLKKIESSFVEKIY